MINFVEINDFSAPELDVFVRLTGAQLRCKLEADKGVFIAESPTVIEVALDRGIEPISLLTDKRLLHGSVEKIIKKCEEKFPHLTLTVYVAERSVLSSLTGFELTRGILAAMKRPLELTPQQICHGKRRIAVLEEITDSTNIGALFRSAAALGIDAVLVTPTCCDPLCRRAVRVSMGTVLSVPFARISKTPKEWEENGINLLHALGFKCAAMALSDDSVNIDDKALLSEERLAVILGTEGTGLKKGTIEAADYTVKIPMSNDVDSLNVGAAGAIAFWQITR